MKRYRLVFTLIFGVTVALVVLAPLAKAPRNASGGAPAPLPNPLVMAAGRVEPVSEEVRLGLALTGKLEAVLVDEGDPVHQGQVLARLERADLQSRVAEAEANVLLKQAELTRLLNGARLEERREAEAAVRGAEAVVEQARYDLNRYRTLSNKGWTSQDSLEKAQRDHAVAVARLAAAREHLALVAATAREDERDRAEADLALARARLEEARAVLAKAEIKSPINGIVLRKHRRAGEMISESQDMPILSIGDISVLRVRAEVDETDIARLQVNQPAWVRADTFGEARFTGRVVKLGTMVGNKRVYTDQPTERLDNKVLEVLIELDGQPPLPVGLRVDAFIDTNTAALGFTGGYPN